VRRGVAAMAIVLGLAGCGGSGGDGGGGPRPPARDVAGRPGFVGVTAGAPLLASRRLEAEQLPRMPPAGATSLRVALYWSAIEPARGRTHFAAADALMTAAAKARLDVLPVLLGTPGWAAADPARSTASPPRDPADFAAFARLMVRRYGPGGSFWRAHPSLPADPVRAWQVWNEPNHVFYWSRQPFAPGYVRLARAARAAIKAADPRALVVSAGFADRSWELVGRLERAGGRGVFDVIAIHPYTFEPANVLKIVRLVRAALRRAGDGARPLWATEVTWSSGKGKVAQPLGFETTPADQAARLGRALPLLAARRRELNLQRIYWESWLTRDANRGNPFDFSGLNRLSPTGRVTPKPALAAYRRFAVRCRRGRC
jgi:polysaccharide biosynthesis protein PslG